MVHEVLLSAAVESSAGDGAFASLPPHERAIHDATIDALAGELRRPVAEVRRHYGAVLQRLLAGARIRDFLSVCATRHLRALLRHAP